MTHKRWILLGLFSVTAIIAVFFIYFTEEVEESRLDFDHVRAMPADEEVNLLSTEPWFSTEPQFPFMAGSVLVNVVLVQCQGVSECSEHWTEADETAIKNSLHFAFDHWEEQVPEIANLEFQMNYIGIQYVGLEPIKHSSYDDGLWIAPALVQPLKDAGYSQSSIDGWSYFQRVQRLNDVTRFQHGTDFVTTVFRVPAHFDPDHRFAESNDSAYTYLGSFGVTAVPTGSYANSRAGRQVSRGRHGHQRGRETLEGNLPLINEFNSPIRVQPDIRNPGTFLEEYLGRRFRAPVWMQRRMQRDTSSYEPGLNFVDAHEFGHSGGARDQYSGKNCDIFAGYLNRVVNDLEWLKETTQNIDASVGSCRNPRQLGLMAGSAWTLSQSTLCQLGLCDHARYENGWRPGSDGVADAFGAFVVNNPQLQNGRLTGTAQIHQMPLKSVEAKNYIRKISVWKGSYWLSKNIDGSQDLVNFDFSVNQNQFLVKIKVEGRFGVKEFQMLNPKSTLYLSIIAK